MRAVAENEAIIECTECTERSERFVVRRERLSGELDPIELLAAAPAGEPVFYLERPDAGEAVVATGSVAEVRTAGAARFAEAAGAARDLLASLVVDADAIDDRGPGGALPRLVGGFAFGDTIASPLWHDFVPCRLVLPRAQWILEGGRWTRFEVARADELEPARAFDGTSRALTALAALPGSSTLCSDDAADEAAYEDGDKWLARARTALVAIEQGRLDKIVIARRETRTLSSDVDVLRVLAELRASRPSCYTFCIASGGSIFLGSSPEKLLGVQGRRVDADALAGTIARGKTPEEDRAQAGALAASEKELREHGVVVADVRETLAPFVSDLEAADRPTARAFPEGYHLHTSVRGIRSGTTSVLELAGAVHPTPAVCGAPRSRAQELLHRVEADRGWYSGGVGWTNAEGEGLFAVALRAGLFADGRLTTWAGAGIVAGSNVERELDETALKMRALLGAIGDLTR
jgi:menaquinone-specific isochorismate synthase